MTVKHGVLLMHRSDTFLYIQVILKEDNIKIENLFIELRALIGSGAGT